MRSQWQLDGLSTAELMDLGSASMDILRAREFDRLGNLARLDLLDEFEQWTRTIPGIGHELINQLGRQNAAEELRTTNLAVLLSERLHITSAEAKRRIANASALGPSTGLGGQPIPAEHAPTGQGQRDGDINTEHADVIVKFFKRLPTGVSTDDREKAEAQLVDLATQTHPDAVEAAARQIEAYLNPDGDLPDESDRREKTYFRMKPQSRDKLTRGSFCIDAELRAYLEAYLAKAGQRGVGNPEDERPIFHSADVHRPAGRRGWQSDTTPGQQDLFDYFSEPPEPPRSAEPPSSAESAGPAEAAADDHTESVRRDRRSVGQRYHDAIKRLVRSALGSPGLGQHRGLPVTAIITMTLAELESATGNAMTGGGTMVPMRDAIRMASHAHHYLVIYDDVGRPLHLGRSKRLASQDQRIVLYAGDRGCTFPNCTRPGYWCQTHHIDEWAAEQGRTDIDRLTFACAEHHALVGLGEHDWATTVCPPDGAYPFRTIWHPPASVDRSRRGRVNHYHFPGEYLLPPESLPGPPGYAPQRQRARGSNAPPPCSRRRPPKRE